MSLPALIVTVRLLDDRYHGEGDWPPSPFRLFQALLAGAQCGRCATAEELDALRWLEGLDPPIIAAPKSRRAKLTTSYVPGNLGDAFGGDLAKAAKKRNPKNSQPRLLDADLPFLYVWTVHDHGDHAPHIVRLAERLYQLGRGIDFAHATAAVIEMSEAETRLKSHAGTLHYPTPGGTGPTLRCPARQHSLDSLIIRHAGQMNRLQGGRFRQAPPPRYVNVAYDCPPSRRHYTLESTETVGQFSPQPLTKIAQLTETIRDLVAARLAPHYPGQVGRYLTGRDASADDKLRRIRLIPLPSIGHHHVNRDIRRLMIEIPPNCPIPDADIHWAASGLNLAVDLDMGEPPALAGPVLVPSHFDAMTAHYGVNDDGETRARLWRTVTPVVLPRVSATKRKANEPEADDEIHSVRAIRQALRHAGLDQPATVRRVQREPFESGGARAGDFAHGSRFAAGRLRHVEILFDQVIAGPLLLGDGRFYGLGLFHPVAGIHRDLFTLPLLPDNRPPLTQWRPFLTAVRRALMSLDRDLNDAHLGRPGRLFSGHEADGAPARSGRHDHVFLAADDRDGDGLIDRLLIVAPWRADRSAGEASPAQQRQFEQVADSLKTIRAGKLGIIQVGPAAMPVDDDPITGLARHWISRTPYRATRHARKKAGLDQALVQDIRLECLRRGLPEPEIEIVHIPAAHPDGLQCWARLRFAVAVAGPLLLGRDSHAGGGMFIVECTDDL